MSLSQQERWFYNLSLPFSYLFIDHENGNTKPEFYSTDVSLEEAFKGWDINDRESLLLTIERMTDNGHAGISNLPYAIFSRGLPSEWQAHKAEEKTSFMQFIDDMVETTGHLVQSGGIRAWDYSRMSLLARAGYNTKLITYDELLWIHYELALRTQYFFSNWPQYFSSHFIGWHYWLFNGEGMESLEDWQLSFIQQNSPIYQEQFQKVMADPDCKNLPWALYLETVEKPESMVEINW